MIAQWQAFTNGLGRALSCSVYDADHYKYRYEDYGDHWDHDHYLDRAQHGAWGADRATDHFPWSQEEFFQAPQVYLQRQPAYSVSWTRHVQLGCTMLLIEGQVPYSLSVCCQAHAGNYLWLDPHILCTPVLADIDQDGHDDLVVAASYFFDRDQYDTPVRRHALLCRLVTAHSCTAARHACGQLAGYSRK